MEHVIQNPGFLPDDLRPYFFGARLAAIRKPNGGIRPIAVGTILRKLTSQAFADMISPQLPQFFCPYQHGVGVPGGAENVVQGLRLLQALDSSNIVVGLDFTNAFNSIERSVIAAEVEDKFPQVSTWFDLCYGKPSHLLVRGRQPISSERGVQQGDPLGPFFFALALQPALIEAAKGCFIMAYLDDIYICGHKVEVEKAIKTLLLRTSKIGLECNLSKCWATNKITVDHRLLTVDPTPKVLGVPLNVSEELSRDLVPCELMGDIADLPDLQIALHLLRYVHNSRLTYHIRLSSTVASLPVANEMMLKTRKALSTMLKREDIPEAAWQQALLPKGPGLGLTNLPEMASYMICASLLEATAHLASMDPNTFGQFASPAGWSDIKDTELGMIYNQALQAVNSINGEITEYAKLQHSFAVHVVTPRLLSQFLQNPDFPDTSKAIVRSTCYSPIASQFLQAIPTQRGLTLSSPEMRVALHLLLGIKLEMNSDECTGCRGKKLLTMYHALSCKKHGGLTRRHDFVKHILGDICRHARLSFEVEPKQSVTGTKLKPDLLVRYGQDGHDLAYDVTIINPLRDAEAVACTLRDEQAFLFTQHKVKCGKYQDKCAENGAAFCPIVLSAFGGVHQNSFENGINYLISKIKRSSFIPPNWAAPTPQIYWLQRIAISLWSGNVRKVKPFLKQEPLKHLAF